MKTQLPITGFNFIRRRGVQLAVCVLLASLLISSLALAQSGTGPAIPWWTIDSGISVTSSGSGYSLAGTIGQPDTGVAAGSGYILRGGFWSFTQISYKLNLPLVQR